MRMDGCNMIALMFFSINHLGSVTNCDKCTSELTNPRGHLHIACKSQFTVIWNLEKQQSLIFEKVEQDEVWYFSVDQQLISRLIVTALH